MSPVHVPSGLWLVALTALIPLLMWLHARRARTAPRVTFGLTLVCAGYLLIAAAAGALLVWTDASVAALGATLGAGLAGAGLLVGTRRQGNFDIDLPAGAVVEIDSDDEPLEPVDWDRFMAAMADYAAAERRPFDLEADGGL